MSKKQGPTIKHAAGRVDERERARAAMDLEGGHEDLVRAEQDAGRPDYNPGIARHGGGGVKNRKDGRANVRLRR